MTPGRRRRGTTSADRAAGLTLDAGALIALDRGDRNVAVLIKRAATTRDVRVPAGVLAQVWRDGASQARIARLLSHSRTQVVTLDAAAAKAAGTLCGRAGTDDVVDASVVVCAVAHADLVLTSDPGDLAHLAPDLRLSDVSALKP